MHNSRSWSNSVQQHSWSQRSVSASSQRTATSHKAEYTHDCVNASMEEMEWSDTSSLDPSNNSFTSPTTFRSQSSHPSGSWKVRDNTSPSSLLSSLNIAEFPRPRSTTQPFASPKTVQNAEASSAHHSPFHLSQSMSKLSQSNLSSSRPKLPFVASDFSSNSLTLPSMKPKLFTTSKLDCSVSEPHTSIMPSLAAFHRTFYHTSKSMIDAPSFHDDSMPSDFDQESILSALSRDALGNESVMKSEDASFQRHRTAEETNATDNLSDEEGNSFENKMQNLVLKKRRISTCSCLFRASCYSLLAVLVIFGAVLIPHTYFQFRVCDTHVDMSLVRHALRSNVFGQHLAVEVVSDRLGQFLNDSEKKLLVLSFQGWTGIGKNHMSNILSRFLQTGNIHRYIVTLHFASNAELDMETWMRTEITTRCGIHLFVIDEMDKASDILVSGLRKALHSTRKFLSNHSHTRAVVLLLSNTGSAAINAYTAQVLEMGVLRENIACDGLVDRLETALQNTWYSEMLKEKLIDQLVPFLPLEKAHVEKCAAAALGFRQIAANDEIISAVLNRLSYSPLSNSVFSTTGCRKVNAELDLVLY